MFFKTLPKGRFFDEGGDVFDRFADHFVADLAAFVEELTRFGVIVLAGKKADTVDLGVTAQVGIQVFGVDLVGFAPGPVKDIRPVDEHECLALQVEAVWHYFF